MYYDYPYYRYHDHRYYDHCRPKYNDRFFGCCDHYPYRRGRHRDRYSREWYY
jgi:hypothetical protein